MARITVEDCLEKVSNRFALIHLAAKRVRQLRKGVEPLVIADNTDTVIALREIAAGKVFMAKMPEQTEVVEGPSEAQIQAPSEEIDGSEIKGPEKAALDQEDEEDVEDSFARTD